MSDRTDLLVSLVTEYAQHDSWRCGYPDRYPLVDGDCVCGLIGALREAGIDPAPWTAAWEKQSAMKRDLLEAADRLDNPPRSPEATVIRSAEGGMLFEGGTKPDEKETL